VLTRFCCDCPICSCSPPTERSLRSACNRRRSAASRPGSGEETTSANVVRNPPASVSGSCIVRSGGTKTVGRRIATGSFDGNLPRAASRPYVDNATMGNLFRGCGYFLRSKDSNVQGATAPHLFDFSEGCPRPFDPRPGFPAPPPLRRRLRAARPARPSLPSYCHSPSPLARSNYGGAAPRSPDLLPTALPRGRARLHICSIVNGLARSER
jgi:hypothetical protein